MLKLFFVQIAKAFKMKSLSSVRLILLFAGLTSLVLLSVSESANAFPLPHWVENTPGGFDSFMSTATIEVEVIDSGQNFTAVFSGPTTVLRSDPFDNPDPLDPGHNNQIDTEIVSMNLTADSPFGPLTLLAGINEIDIPSPGAIIEQVNDPSLADSFFDVFFELQGTPFGPLRNQEPAHMTAVIDGVPPLGIPYIYDGPPILMFDQAGDPQVSLIHADHTPKPIPEPATIALLGIGLVGLAGGAARRKWKKKAVDKS